MIPFLNQPNLFIPHEPILERDFIIESSLPSEISDDIIGYDLDTESKRLTLIIILSKLNLGLMVSPISVESIVIRNYDREGIPAFKTYLEGIKDSLGLSIFGRYESDDLLSGRLVFKFESFYQETC
jgi:hypothetical protein